MMKNRVLSAFRNTATILLVVWMVNCFPDVAWSQSYQFTQYTQEDGLSTGSISQIFRDRTGYFWILSESDLVRFDEQRMMKPQCWC
jgi:hypothetical protein